VICRPEFLQRMAAPVPRPGLHLIRFDGVLERSLSTALWDEVKDRLDASGLSPSGGQRQRRIIDCDFPRRHAMQRVVPMRLSAADQQPET